MSGSDGSAGSDQEADLQFSCRKCPGKVFSAAEKDSHRLFHRQQKEKEKNRKPGPKSKTRSSARVRDHSPTMSEVTLFKLIESPKQQPTKKRRLDKKKNEAPSKKKSKKSYNTKIIGDWSRGTGA